ncbi:MAG TPA: energy transducer TonB [Dyella sp.]|uniref:energy transducer TonB n=1 Tax=Dyella sp. TaxID=1869338 RepID=UPI002F92FFB3
MSTTRRSIIGSLLLGALLAGALPVQAQDAPRVAPEGLVNHWILLNTKVDADIPNSGHNLDKPVCAAIKYTVGSDGVPLNVEVAKVVPQSDLGTVGEGIVKRFRYGPSLSNQHAIPVDTYYVISFNLPTDPAQAKQITDACRLPGYAAS